MATFNQNNSSVQSLQNAESINNYHDTANDELFILLNQLMVDLHKASERNQISMSNAKLANKNINEVILQTQESQPDKKIINQYLTDTKDLVSHVGDLGVAVNNVMVNVDSLFI